MSAPRFRLWLGDYVEGSRTRWWCVQLGHIAIGFMASPSASGFMALHVVEPRQPERPRGGEALR